jgi:hypothetical protein
MEMNIISNFCSYLLHYISNFKTLDVYLQKGNRGIEMKREWILFATVLILSFLLCSSAGALFYKKGDRMINSNPFHVQFTEPEKIIDMVIDAENRTAYIGTDWGLVVRDLDTGESMILDRTFGFNDPKIQEMELDTKEQKLYVLTDYDDGFYIIDIERMKMERWIRFTGTKNQNVTTRFDHICYDGASRTIFLAGSTMFYKVDLEEGT